MIQDPPPKNRPPEYPADRLFVERWSPRGFTQDQITEPVLNTFFEAMWWAPSAFNFPAMALSLCPTRPARIRNPFLPFIPRGKTAPQFSPTHSLDSGWANFAN